MKPNFNRISLAATALFMVASSSLATAADDSTTQSNATEMNEAASPNTKDSAVQEGAMEESKMTQKETKPVAKLSEVTELIAAIAPVGGSNVSGSVLFEQASGGVKVTAKIGGLEPNTKHGFHIHEYGDTTALDGSSAGGHYNPEGHDHALPTEKMRHAGDLGNLEADAEGNAMLEITVDNVSLAGDMNPIIGRAIIIHAKPDDGGQPTGNAGDRIGAGVIGISSADSAE